LPIQQNLFSFGIFIIFDTFIIFGIFIISI